MPTQWSEAEQVPLGCIAPYAVALPRHISPSVTAFGRDTSLAEGGEGERIPTPVTSVTGSE